MTTPQDSVLVPAGEEVLTLGEDASVPVLDVASAEWTAQHWAGHLTTLLPTGGGAVLGQVRFHDTAGRDLVLAPTADGAGLEWRLRGTRTPLEDLQERIAEVVRERLRTLQVHWHDLPVPPPALQGTWSQQFHAVERRYVELTGQPDRRGWFHNFFVHGGNP